MLKLSLPQEIALSTIIESWLIVEDAKMSNDGAPYVPLWGFEANSKWICLPPCLAFNYVKTYSSCPFNSSLSVTNRLGIKIKKNFVFFGHEWPHSRSKTRLEGENLFHPVSVKLSLAAAVFESWSKVQLLFSTWRNVPSRCKTGLRWKNKSCLGLLS